MNIEEVYTLIAQRMLQGIMTHEQLANYYNFLGLEGYKYCHEYHLNEEFCHYRKFVSKYIKNNNRLLPKQRNEDINSNIIPDNWYSFNREDVDINTRRNAVKNGVEKWIHLEKETRRLFEDMYIELINMNEISLALSLNKNIENIEKEIHIAEQKYLKLKATDFDMPTIISQQECLKKKYKKKLNKRKEIEHDKS